MKFFYRYKKNNESTQKELTEQNFWFSKPISFNDPCDCAMHLLHANGRVQTMDELEHHLSHSRHPIHLLERLSRIDKFENIRNNVLNRIKNKGICCFTTKFDNPLMWAHYASEHKGFCLEYTVIDEDALLNFHKVNYSNKFDAERIMQSYLQRGGICKELDLELLTTKPKDWEYEDEYRYIKNTGDVKHFLPTQLSSIIFGARFPEESIEDIIKILSKYPTRPKLKRAKIDSQSFNVKVVEWSDQRLLSKYGKF